MNPSAWLRPRWLFSRRAAKALLLAIWSSSPRPWANNSSASTSSAALPAGSGGWRRAGYFWWRLCLYARRFMAGGGCAAGCYVGPRGSRGARRRLVRSEIAGVVAIVALEASLLMQG